MSTFWLYPFATLRDEPGELDPPGGHRGTEPFSTSRAIRADEAISRSGFDAAHHGLVKPLETKKGGWP
jgi:hypothetical protein